VHWRPAFPTPSVFLGERLMHHSGAIAPRDGELCLMNANAPHFQPSSSAKADDPYSRDADDRIERPRRTDRPVKPDDDNSLWRSESDEGMRRPCERRTHNHRSQLEQKALATVPKRESAAYGSLRSQDDVE